MRVLEQSTGGLWALEEGLGFKRFQEVEAVLVSFMIEPDKVACMTNQQEDFGALEEGLGFERFQEGEDRLGWLLNYNPVRMLAAEHSPHKDIQQQQSSCKAKTASAGCSTTCWCAGQQSLKYNADM